MSESHGAAVDVKLVKVSAACLGPCKGNRTESLVHLQLDWLSFMFRVRISTEVRCTIKVGLGQTVGSRRLRRKFRVRFHLVEADVGDVDTSLLEECFSSCARVRKISAEASFRIRTKAGAGSTWDRSGQHADWVRTGEGQSNDLGFGGHAELFKASFVADEDRRGTCESDKCHCRRSD